MKTRFTFLAFILLICSTGAIAGVLPPPNDDCSNVTPVTLTNGVPVTFTGTTVGGTASADEISVLGSGAVWEAVTLTGGCNQLTVDYCGTAAGLMETFYVVYSDCPLTAYTIGSYDNTCADGNGVISFTDLPAGTYYLPVIADTSYNPLGDYTMNVVTESTCCTALPATGTPGFFPAPDDVPCIERNVFYDFTMQLENFVTINGPTGTVTVDWLRIDSIENLPCGISWVTNQLQYNPGETGCITVSGTTQEAVGQYPLKIYVSVQVNIPLLGTQIISGELKDLYTQAGLTVDNALYVSRVIKTGNACPARDINSTSVASEECALANDDCSGVTPVTLFNGVPVTFTGTTVGATASADEINVFGSGTVWEAVTLTGACNNLTVEYCGTAPGIMSGSFIIAYTDCPLTTYTSGSYDQTTCGDGNATIFFSNLPAGTYYLPVLADPNLNTAGDYIMNVLSESNCCIATPATGIPGVSPAPDDIPCIERNVSYNFTMHLENFVTFPSAVGTVTVDWTRIDSIENLPCGISWLSDKLQYDPGETGCITVYGTTQEAVGQYPLRIYISMQVTIPNVGTQVFSGELKDLLAQAGLTDDYRYVSRVIEAGDACPTRDTTSTLVASEVCTIANDDCSSIVPVTLTNGTPVTFRGTTEGATTSAEESSGLGEGAVWEAVTLTGTCNNLTVDYCGTAPGVMTYFFIIYTDCPPANSTGGSYENTTCFDGNGTLRFSGLSAGTYYLPVLADASLNTLGTYTMNVVSESCSTSASISGMIESETSSPINTVTVEAYSTGSTQSMITASDGNYTFDLSPGSDYTITPSKSNDVVTNNGVSTVDILLIRRHLLAVQSLATPYKIIAADVNESGTVTTLDVVLIRTVILATNPTFPNGKLWSFVPDDYVFPNPQNPFGFPTSRSYPNLTGSYSDQNFIGIKLGDVNNNWDPLVAKQGATGNVQMAMSEYHAMTGDEIIVPVKVKDFKNVTGYQFTLSWNPEVLALLDVNNKSLNGYYGMQKTSEGYLTTTWYDDDAKDITLNDDETVFELKFKAIGASGSQSAIKIGSELTVSEAYDENLDLLDVVASNGMVKVGEISSVVSHQPSAVSLAIQPNPFSNSTNIIFTLPQDETVTLSIYDVLGKEVKHITADYKAGEHQVEWHGDDAQSDALSKGLYHVRMIAGSNALSRKVVMTR